MTILDTTLVYLSLPSMTSHFYKAIKQTQQKLINFLLCFVDAHYQLHIQIRLVFMQQSCLHLSFSGYIVVISRIKVNQVACCAIFLMYRPVYVSIDYKTEMMKFKDCSSLRVFLQSNTMRNLESCKYNFEISFLFCCSGAKFCHQFTLTRQ